MQKKKALLSEIVDVYGLRIVVDEIDTCYRGLGVVHSVYKPMPALQGLHRNPPRQRLPVACTPRSSGRTACPSRCRSARKTCIASPSPASPRTGRTRPTPRATPRSRSAPRRGCRVSWRCRRAATRKNSSRVSRSTSSRTRCTCSRPRARSCDCRAVPPWWTSRTQCTPTSATAACREDRPAPHAAAHGAAQRPDGADHHGEGRVAESGLGQLRGHGEGAHRHPPLSQGAQAFGGHRPRQAAAQPGTGRVQAHAVEGGRHGRCSPRSPSSACVRPTSCSKRWDSASAWRRWSRADCCRRARSTRLSAAQPLAVAGTEGLLVSYAHCCYPIPDDPILAFLSTGPRHRRASRDVRERGGLSQASREVAGGRVAAEPVALFQVGDPHRGAEPHGRARVRVGGDLGYADQHRTRHRLAA